MKAVVDGPSIYKWFKKIVCLEVEQNKQILCTTNGSFHHPRESQVLPVVTYLDKILNVCIKNR